jgi:hypothetical protein
LPSAIGAGLKESSIALVSVHALAAPPEELLGSEDRSATLDVALSALTTALLTAPVTALVTALLWTPPIARKLPLARDTSANPTPRDKTPSQIRHLLRTPAEFADFDTDVFGWTSRGRWVDMPLLLG